MDGGPYDDYSAPIGHTVQLGPRGGGDHGTSSARNFDQPQEPPVPRSPQLGPNQSHPFHRVKDCSGRGVGQGSTSKRCSQHPPMSSPTSQVSLVVPTAPHPPMSSPTSQVSLVVPTAETLERERYAEAEVEEVVQ